jgi:hypothetical protein
VFPDVFGLGTRGAEEDFDFGTYFPHMFGNGNHYGNNAQRFHGTDAH